MQKKTINISVGVMAGDKNDNFSTVIILEIIKKNIMKISKSH